MPWKKLSPERIFKFYKDAFMDIQSRKSLDMDIKALIVRAEILKHDFTKRQVSILLFIYTFSYCFGKEEAYIPKLQDFELVGISKTKVRQEILKLEKMDVLNWDRENCLFRIRDHREWEVNVVSGYNDSRAKELYLMNLQDSGVDVKSMMYQLRSEV